MYCCRDCGASFENPRVYEESHGLPERPFEMFYLCPECSSEDYSLYTKGGEKCRD